VIEPHNWGEVVKRAAIYVRVALDAPDYALNLPLGLVAVLHVAQPNARDFAKLHNIIAQWSFEVFHVRGKTRPKVLR
jgi:hypothetical protein